MKTCPYCRQNTPDDSVYCVHCGKPLEKAQHQTEEEIKQARGSFADVKTEGLAPNPRQNPFGRLGLFLCFFGLVVLDCGLGTILANTTGSHKIAFYISSVVYALAIACGVLSLVVDSQDRKKGLTPTGGTLFGFGPIAMSLFLLIQNWAQVILK